MPPAQPRSQTSWTLSLKRSLGFRLSLKSGLEFRLFLTRVLRVSDVPYKRAYMLFTFTQGYIGIREGVDRDL